MEGESLCIIHYAAGSCLALWVMADVMEEVLNVGRRLMSFFFQHVKWVANEVADGLAE